MAKYEFSWMCWEMAEVARRRGGNWRCFCGHWERSSVKEDSNRYFMHIHLEDDHKMVFVEDKKESENYS
jgi:hypothetical protein